MGVPKTRPFHLHYHVPDVGYAEQVLAETGLPLRAKFGSVDGEPVTVEAGEELPDGFRFRLQDAQRGYVNVTLTSGKRVQYDHLGIVTSAFDEAIERAKDADWTVQGVKEPRTFLITPWGFRIEIHPEGGRIANGLGSWEESRFEEIVLTVPDPIDVKEGLEDVLGSISELTVDKGESQPHVPRATVGGQAFPDETTIQATSLSDDSEVTPSEDAE